VQDRTHVVMKERKTGKIKRFLMPIKLRESIEVYTQQMAPDAYLFASRKGLGPISPTQAYRVFVKAAAVLGRSDVGTHTMRKTFGYHHYKQHKDVAVLQSLFNHSAPSITLTYIGVTSDEIDATVENFSL
jgi:integrase